MENPDRLIDGTSTQRLTLESAQRIDSKYTRTSDGAGLGLAISRDLARGMDGDVTVVSRVGEGTAFTLHLRASAVA